MRLRTFTLAIATVGLLVGGCSDGDGEETTTPVATPAAESTPAPTATPRTRIPEPIIVTRTSVPGSGASAEEAVEYTVEAGDTISGISERFGVDPDLIRQANEIEGDDIFVGQTLLIPRDGSALDTGDGSTGGATPPPVPSGDNTYVVQEGDTAFGIALEFDTTVEALAAANGMTEDEIADLQIGQVINLPTPE